jgi:peptide/nickel transport system permease protein
MKRYLVRRLLLAILVIYGVSVITFILSRVVPGDPVLMWVGHKARTDQIEQARKELGFDKPLVVQYLVYIKKLMQGDLGESLRSRQKVSGELSRRYAATFELVTVSMTLALLIGIPIGVLSATHKDSWIDHLSRFVSISGVAMPVFWLGMILQILFHGQLHIFPLQARLGDDIVRSSPIASTTGLYLIDSLITWNLAGLESALKHIALPAITLSFASLAIITRMTRSCMLEVLSEDYVQTSRAFGVSNAVINYKYALKNALIPTTTVVGLSIGYLLGGSFLVESIFDWPGVGGYAVMSIMTNDFPAIMGVTISFAATYVLVNFLVDMVYFLIDPRIKSPRYQD